MQALQHGKKLSFPSFPNTPIQRIVILVAMPEEATPIIKILNLKPCDLGLDPHLNLVTYHGTFQGRAIHLVVNGTDPIYGVAQVGTDTAVLSTYETIRKLKPDTIISAGTAGGYKSRGAMIGDVYIGSGSFVFHDRRIPCGQGYIDYGQGFYPCLSAPALVNALQLKSGIISTGNSLSLSAMDNDIIQKNGAVAKDMEVAAIANVARQFNVRVMAIKGITNLASLSADAGQAFESNFDSTVDKIAQKIPGVLQFILGKTPQQLGNPLALVESRFLASVNG